MLLKFIVFISLLQLALSKPQFITFKDGRIGVNFGGYHAEAGLGGFLTGNAAHGGLSASAGTPFGQRAGAGIGGSLDGRSAGGAYAGATAGNGVGASAAIGGSLDGKAQGGYGAEAHAGGKSKSVKIQDGLYESEVIGEPEKHSSVVQVIKPQTKKVEIKNEVILETPKPAEASQVIDESTIVSGKGSKHLGFDYFSKIGAQYGGEPIQKTETILVPRKYVIRQKFRPKHQKVFVKHVLIPAEKINPEVDQGSANNPNTVAIDGNFGTTNIIKAKHHSKLVQKNFISPTTNIEAGAEAGAAAGVDINTASFFDSLFSIFNPKASVESQYKLKGPLDEHS